MSDSLWTATLVLAGVAVGSCLVETRERVRAADAEAQCPPVRVTLDVPPCTETRDASAITCAMAIGATVDAMQREAAIDDWAEERAADDSIDAQVPLERWKELP